MYFKGTKKLKLYKIVPLNPEELELKIESMLGKEDKMCIRDRCDCGQ